MIKITYITHSSILIETEDAKAITDPWFSGSAYLNHWHVFPKPVDISYANDVTHIIISHGHEDHCHIPSLKHINKQAHVLIPYTWLNGSKELLESIGFVNTQEIDSYKTVQIGSHLKLTFIVNGLDAVFVLEYKGKVYVNLNDAFNATHQQFIKLFASTLLSKWPVIHYLMSGVGGAGYFPNTIHSPLKDDTETGVQREQFLMKLFCEFVAAFKPEKAIPFLPGFVLLEPDKRWINMIRQPRHLIKSYYAELGLSHPVIFWNFYPNDFLLNDQWHQVSPYYNDVKDDDWGAFASLQYATEIMDYTPVKAVEQDIDSICIALNNLFVTSTIGLHQSMLRKLDFIIQLSDIENGRNIHCYYSGKKLIATPSSQLASTANLMIRTNSTNLLHSINELWGGDVFFIGYGADIDILNPTCLKDNLDILSLRVLSVFPTAKQHIRKQPYRAFRYFWHNRAYALLAIKQKIQFRKNNNKLPFNERSRWIQLSKCETCRACDLPLLDDTLAGTIV
jgi:hypothetical protein